AGHAMHYSALGYTAAEIAQVLEEHHLLTNDYRFKL
ncbi:hypothetical protein PSYMO_37801, partial [Pseudomonas amygdali pv. mori str. 301020]